MKVFTLMKTTALTLLFGAVTSVSAQETTGDGCDLRIWQVFSPTASALASQPVKFSVRNNGATAASHFTAGVILNEDTVCQKTYDNTINSEDVQTLDLGYNVDCPYGETTSLRVFVHADNDADSSNDYRDVSVNMPRQLPYPYTWDTETSKNDFTYNQFWGMGWGYDDTQFNAFYMTGKATNWMGDLASLPIDFPTDGKVMCAFDYGTSGADVLLDVVIDYGDSRDTLSQVKLEESTQDFSTAFFSFTAKKAAIVRISASLDASWNTYGSIYLRNICFKEASKDLSTKAIVSPTLSQMALSDDPIPVKVTYKNASPIDIVNPTFCYQVGDEVVRETYEGTVTDGAALTYEFTKPLSVSSAKAITLKAWCEADGDKNASNDSISKDFTFYEALSFPYTTTFDEGNDNWATVDNNNDGTTWGFYSMTDGNNVAAFADNYATCNDLLVSPAIVMPEGKARVSFYYSGAYRSGGVELKLYMNTTPTTEGADLLFDQKITNSGWLNGYHALDINTAGNRYFIFEVTGSGDQIIIDNFKVDAAEDLCINKVAFDTKSGYKKTTSKVTLSYINHGLTPQKNIVVRYYINDLNHYAEETVTDAVASGDTIYYTFEEEADLSTEETVYQLYGQIVTPVGEDTQNDMIQGESVEHYKVAELPYYQSFTDETRNERWTFTSTDTPDSQWQVNNYWFAYDGDYDLMHTNYSGEPSDDWAYSECFHLPVGKYDVSLFYRGRTYFASDDYNQSFEVKMGQDCTPEAMTISVGQSDNEDVYQPAYRKMGKVVEITEEGDYYLGIHSTSVANQGETHIDAVSVKPAEEGLALPFESDFANDSTAWTWYNSNARNFTKWQVEDGKAALHRTTEDSWNYFEGLLVTPKLSLVAGAKVNVEVAYKVTCDADTLSLQLYGGKENNPSAMKVLAKLPTDKDTYTYEMVPQEDETEYYFGFRTNTNPDDQDTYYYGPYYDVELTSLKISYDATADINDRSDNALAVRLANGRLSIDSKEPLAEVSLYDAAGRLLASTQQATTHATLSYGQYKGVAVLKMKTAHGTTIKKIAL